MCTDFDSLCTVKKSIFNLCKVFEENKNSDIISVLNFIASIHTPFGRTVEDIEANKIQLQTIDILNNLICEGIRIHIIVNIEINVKRRLILNIILTRRTIIVIHNVQENNTCHRAVLRAFTIVSTLARFCFICALHVYTKSERASKIAERFSSSRHDNNMILTRYST